MNARTIGASQGLRFFARVTASLSHELNNVLASIYENAGLAEDLISAAERGRPLDPARLKDLAARVRSQVRRGRDIVASLNRFAHCADDSRCTIDLREFVNLVAALAQRTASMHEIALEPVKGETAVEVTTDPFLLQNLAWLCLDFIMSLKGSAKTIRLIPDGAGSEARIRFTGLKSLPEGGVFPTEAQQAICRALGARLSMDGETGDILLMIPKDAP